ncbi:glycine betaine ABC transporter substrate-binding protein [Candidatus Poriferisodalis sp.]|uniref:glycine betaine ABC transporter substrate-binding protein n=1 Tax=Candidatus Poriferisodalis sp. TaxID=3101277 RepID=UPI003B5A33AF
MKSKRWIRLLLLLAAFALFAAACGDDDDGDATATEETAAPAGDDAMDDDHMEDDDHMDDDAMDDDHMDDDAMSMTPGEGVTATMGRASWSTGYFQAELYRDLMEELGYDVTDPAELELGPNSAYVAMAEGQLDFWVNSWYPGHLAWLAGELPDGSLVGDHLSIVGEEMIAGGLQGFLITKSFADEYGVYSLDELNRNPEALAAFDATDPVPDNGMADIFGCPEAWTCDNVITNQIAFSGWNNIQQVIAGYDAMFAQAVDSAGEGVPMVIYTWTPSAYITQLRPGDNVYWAGVESILDSSNPAGEEGGEEHSQRGEDGTGGYAAIGPDQCPAAADHPEGLCPIGWIAADILVTANNDFLAANPAAAKLLEVVKLSVIEVSLANVEQGEGADPGDLAAAWIADNRGTVDAWLDAARAAA